MEKKRILFVDDNPNILSGLKRMLRSMRSEFNACFVESGRKALEIMGTTEFHVVVSDMHMSGMDGVELLTKIKKHYPLAIRIMLTGSVKEEKILRSVDVVHQFLSKPCEVAQLKSVLLRAIALHSLISNTELKKTVSQLNSLPSLPDVYVKLQKATADPEVSVAKIAKIIEEDMAMSAKILQLVNSAFFGIFQKIKSPAHAVNLLGIETLKGLVLGFGAFKVIKVSSNISPISKLWSHSLAVAHCAKTIASNESTNAKLIDDCFIGGLLHDIGKLVLLAEKKDKYEQAILLAEKENIHLQNAEKDIFGILHCEIGAYLMGVWGMPVPVIEAIGFHHCLDNYPNDIFSPAIAVHVANTFCYENRPGEVIGALHEINIPHLKTLGLDGKVEHWRGICSELLEQ